MEKLVRLVEKVIETIRAFPNAVYENDKFTIVDGEPAQLCLYTAGKVKDGPECLGCVIGQALFALWPELKEQVAKSEAKGPFGVQTLVEQFVDHEYVNGYGIVLNWLCDVQSYQDIGNNWLTCMTYANEQLKIGTDNKYDDILLYIKGELGVAAA